jgi:hypothetical protein
MADGGKESRGSRPVWGGAEAPRPDMVSDGGRW